ncbi:MBL fold metallo-hydrolase, partial [Klebsiella pneumoniae]|nr:MBL fold metallo-hydrolase [Klebsiella pneumoniae]
GDLGVSFVSGEGAKQPIRSLNPLPRGMESFHRRYMVSNKILRSWARMVRTLKIDMIVPQHGAPLAGAAVKEFIDWAE